MRVLVMVDGNEDILGVNSNKNQTIKFTYSILDLYRDENNNTVNKPINFFIFLCPQNLVDSVYSTANYTRYSNY